MHQFGHINFTSKNLEIRQNDIERITLHRINTNFFHALYKSIFCHKLNFFLWQIWHGLTNFMPRMQRLDETKCNVASNASVVIIGDCYINKNSKKKLKKLGGKEYNYKACFRPLSFIKKFKVLITNGLITKQIKSNK